MNNLHYLLRPEDTTPGFKDIGHRTPDQLLRATKTFLCIAAAIALGITISCAC